MRRFLALLLSGAILFWSAPSTWACAGCIESVTVGKGKSPEILAGFSFSVLFLLVAVAAVLGGLSRLIARTCRQLEAGRSAVAADSQPKA